MKRILVAVPITLVCFLLLPLLAFRSAQGWDTLGYFIIFFFILFPALAAFLGILAGTDLKRLWWLPVGSAVLCPPFLWIALKDVTLELYLYAAVYLGVSLAAAVPTALIRHALVWKKAQRHAQAQKDEKN